MRHERQRILPTVLLSLLLCTCASAEELPLFTSEAPLDIVLELPLDTILKQAAERPEVEGQLRYVDSTGQPVLLDVQITTRGNSRLEQCRFPPLSISIKKKQAADTLFAGQKKLKLVTHCQNQGKYQQYLLQEYSIYRAFNVLSDVSFRVRYLNISYRNSEKSGRPTDANAFLIESINEVADRSELQRHKVEFVSAVQLDAAYATMSAMFQFLIGNTDWSVLRGADEARCCHNGRVLSATKERTDWRVVPYDFDQAGLINTSYAQPGEKLPIRSVRQRLYRGRCAHIAEIPATVQLFNGRRAALESMLLGENLDGDRRKAARKYVDDFYAIINNEKRLMAYVNRGCLGPA